MQRSLSSSGLSKSSPSLVTAAAFNLRDFSLSRKKIGPDPSMHEPLRKVASYEKIDLIGGNGSWRQRKAVLDFERRRVEEEELKRQERLREMEQQRRRAERREQRRKVKEREETKRREEEQRQLEEGRQRELVRQQQQESARLRRQEEEAERQRRMPVQCTVCEGSGTCQTCSGKGHLYATHLVSSVSTGSLMQYGRNLQGCTNCGGCRQGIRGDLQKGVGKCPECCGLGKIWPHLDSEAGSPKSMLSPKARTLQAWGTQQLPA